MQTKSVLTALSLSILCSTTAFGMGSRITAMLSRSGTKVALAVGTGTALVASPFVTLGVMGMRDTKEYSRKKAAEKERLYRIISITNQLPEEVVNDIEKKLPQIYHASLDEGCFTRTFEGVGNHKQYRQALLDEQLEKKWLELGIQRREESHKRWLD